VINRGRKIGLPLATMLVAGNMIGSGIYLLPATLATVGSITLIAWVIALGGALLVATTIAYLGRIAPTAGGLCEYARDALGSFAGFQSTMFYWASCWIGNIAIGVAAIGYLAKLFPVLGDPVTLAMGVIALIWLLTFLNILGPRIACQVQSLTLIAGLIPIVLVATLGWRQFDSKLFIDSWNVTGQPANQVIPSSLVMVFWAFLGLESASIGTAVVANPQRNVPLATLLGVSLAGVVYITSCAAIMGLIPASLLAKSTAPFADAAQLIVGALAATMVAAVACAKASGSLSGLILVTTQLGKAAADRKLFPAIFARTDKHGVPVINLLIMATIMSGATLLTISPTLNEQFSKMAEMSVLLCLMTYIYACISVWHYRAPTAAETRRYRCVAALAIAGCVWIIAMSGATMLWLAAGFAVVASACYFFVGLRAKSATT
jgi:arginine:agmatine antiporter